MPTNILGVSAFYHDRAAAVTTSNASEREGNHKEHKDRIVKNFLCPMRSLRLNCLISWGALPLREQPLS
jgi:hypothetical protein